MPRKPEDLLESAMGLISNASDWMRPSAEESAVWRDAGRKWLDEYQSWLKQYLLEENSKMPNIKIEVDDEVKDLIRTFAPPAVDALRDLGKLWAGTLGRFDDWRSRKNEMNISSRRIVQTDNGWEYADSNTAAEAPTMRPDSDISPEEWDAMELSAARYVEQAQRDLAATLREQRELNSRRWSARIR